MTTTATRPQRAPAPWLARYRDVRARTVQLTAPLSAEDCALQSMPDASPAKWHLAHTTWFFETFVVAPRDAAYRPFDPAFRVLFNSYYHGVGEQHPRPERGFLSRPSLDAVLAYRDYVDAAMRAPCDDATQDATLAALIELGLNHEEQHQELILTDILHLLSRNPLRPAAYPESGARPAAYPESGARPAAYPESGAPPAAYPESGARPAAYPESGARPAAYPEPAVEPPASAGTDRSPRRNPELDWLARPAGIAHIGHPGDGFAFDNEGPRHRVWLEAFELASRPVTNAEYLAFIDDDGYRRPELWLSLGFDAVRAQGWTAPLYWERDGDRWRSFTLRGMADLDRDAPVTHVSMFEADAYARWAHARLPTEFEWEALAHREAMADREAIVNRAAGEGADARSVWEWTSSSYAPYPGFRPTAGAVGEYNGKFMCNQYVLRGGSSATPPGHVRSTYRNFFPPDARWQFSGVRLARDAR